MLKNKCTKIKNKKAQVWAIDLSIALIIFLGVILLFYKYSISFAPEDPLVNKMIKEGGYASNTLISTGFPENWSSLNLTDTIAIGLLDKEGLMDLNKLNNFTTWINPEGILDNANYSLSKRRINTRYDYYIEFKNSESTSPFDPPIIIGKQPTGQEKQIVKIQRFVAYHDPVSDSINATKLILVLWTTQEA